MHLAPSTAWVWLIACAVVILFFPLAAQFGNLKGKLPHLGLGYRSLGHRRGGFYAFHL